MTQQEHLTTEQLSAFLDKQLTPQEQAFFDAHLQSCQHCQHVLAELRGTVALLRAMPEPPLPRSFTLPTGISQTPAARPQPLPLPTQQRRVPRSMLRRTVRAISTLAAAIAVIFILSGVLSGYHPGGTTASTSAAPMVSSGNSNGLTHTSAGRNLTQPPQAQQRGTPVMKGHQSSTPSASPVASTPVPTPTSTSDGTTQRVPANPPTLPPFLDIGQPAGRLLLGAFLLLLSIVGFIATRRRRHTAW